VNESDAVLVYSMMHKVHYSLVPNALPLIRVLKDEDKARRSKFPSLFHSDSNISKSMHDAGIHNNNHISYTYI
jgi:hypothetical protein